MTLATHSYLKRMGSHYGFAQMMEKRVEQSDRLGVGAGRRTKHVDAGRSFTCLGVIECVGRGNGDLVGSCAWMEVGFMLVSS